MWDPKKSFDVFLEFRGESTHTSSVGGEECFGRSFQQPRREPPTVCHDTDLRLVRTRS
jgi:hypothetical protein